MRGGEASRVDGDVADAGGPLCDAQLAGTRGHVTAILAAHVRDAGADPRLRRPPPRALLRRLDRVRLTVHHRRLTRAQLRHRCRVHYFVLSFIRLRIAEQNTTGRGERKGRYLLFRWVCAPTAHWRTPRLRGIRVPQGLVFDSQWFIPARAGKTTRPRSAQPGCSAHPRAGGENYEAHALAIQTGGSSPRGRGKPPTSGGPRQVERLIPARAGKTTARISARAASRAHPRAGGKT